MRSSFERVSIVTCDFDPPRGGLARALKELKTTLQSQGFFVLVATPSVWHCGFLNRIPGGHLLFSVLLPFVLGAYIRRNHIQTLVLPVGPGGVFLLRRPCGVNVIAVCYHTYFQQQRDVPGESWKRMFVPLERRTLRMATRVLCYSPDTQVTLTQTYGIQRRYVSLVAQLLPIDRFGVGEGQREEGLCICVSRLEQRKGIRVLLKAWPAVFKRFPHVRLLIVGRGPLRQEVAARSRDGVENIESLPEGALHALLMRATVAVYPSYLEGFGLAAAEAMLSGLPVVCSACDGLRSLVMHGDTGLLVPPGDHVALADAICKLLLDEALRERLSAGANVKMRERFARAAAEQAHIAAMFPQEGNILP